jgi:hypothetical protein
MLSACGRAGTLPFPWRRLRFFQKALDQSANQFLNRLAPLRRHCFHAIPDTFRQPDGEERRIAHCHAFSVMPTERAHVLLCTNSEQTVPDQGLTGRQTEQSGDGLPGRSVLAGVCFAGNVATCHGVISSKNLHHRGTENTEKVKSGRRGTRALSFGSRYSLCLCGVNSCFETPAYVWIAGRWHVHPTAGLGRRVQYHGGTW